MSDHYPLLAEPVLSQHTGFILAEEDALKRYLTGLKVPVRPDGAELTDVGVWFRFPEGERQIKYPFITIDLIGADPAYDLFHSDHVWPTRDVYDNEPLYQPSFSPSLPTPPDGWIKMNYAVRNYLPMRLTWQITHHARSSLHDRYLTSIFMTDVLPPRPFWVRCPADDVPKRTERVSMVAGNVPETTESGTKRIFRKIYTVNMLTEIPQQRLADEEVYRVLRVFVPVTSLDQFDHYREEIMGIAPDANLDPLNQFSHAEREQAGELTHFVHEGKQLPTAT